jgi:hypothetical protein
VRSLTSRSVRLSSGHLSPVIARLVAERLLTPSSVKNPYGGSRRATNALFALATKGGARCSHYCHTQLLFTRRCACHGVGAAGVERLAFGRWDVWKSRVLAVRAVATFVAGLTLCIATAVQSQPNDRGSPGIVRTTTFEIPAQPLAGALEHFIAASGTMVAADSSLVIARRSAAVGGIMSPENALRIMLEGTGLDAQLIGPDAYTLVPRAAAVSWSAQPRLVLYGRAIQHAVTKALCQEPVTRPTHYRTVLKLWLSMDGKVREAELGTSTGRPTLDVKLLDALRRVNIGRAVPGDLPQPVKIAVRPTVSGEEACSPDQDDRPAARAAR